MGNLFFGMLKIMRIEHLLTCLTNFRTCLLQASPLVQKSVFHQKISKIVRPISLLFAFSFILSAKAQQTDSIRIGLFVKEFPTKITIITHSSGYELNGQPIKNGEVIQVNLSGDSLKIHTGDGGKHFVKKLNLYGPLTNGKLLIKTNKDEARNYHGTIEIKVIRGVMRVVNTTPMQAYISGVVDAETGPKSYTEFYKVQAIIARTFAIENLEKHQDFGFNLCDQVHCQVFKGTSIRNEIITQATASTQNLVLYEANGTLAYAPYHSNCGGQTETSENVWGGKRDYLCSVKDTYCITESKALWSKQIPMAKWNKWLTRNHLDAMVGQYIDWEQPERKKEIKLGGKTFTTRKLRTDFELSSSFFDLKVGSTSVLFKGKGYGHGVGICQQGASRMASLGYNYLAILSHYYQGLHVAKLKK